MKKTILLLTVITFLSCSSNDEDLKLNIQQIKSKTVLSFSTISYDPGLITFSGSVYSVLKNNSSVDFQVSKLEVHAKNGDLLHSDDSKKTVSKNGGSIQGGKYFAYSFFDVTFKWTIEYENQTTTIQHIFTK